MLMQVEQGVKKLFVMLLLDPVEHSSDLDPWPWGGESIYRNDEFCGTVGIPTSNKFMPKKTFKILQISCIQVTTTSYGFSLGRQICLGFVQDFSGEGGQPVHIG